MRKGPCFIIVTLVIVATAFVVADNSEDWCDCGTGNHWLDVWDPDNPEVKHRIETANPAFVDFGDKYVPAVNWICDGMQDDVQTSSLDGDTKRWYVNLHTERKALCLPFGK